MKWVTFLQGFNASKEIEGRIIEKLKRELGQGIINLLEKDNVTEVMANADGTVWAVSFGGNSSGDLTDIRLTVEDRIAFLGTVATMVNKSLHEETPTVEGILPWDGSRVTGVIPPQSIKGPVFNIRKKANKVYTLDEYIAAKRMTLDDKEIICDAILEKKNIIIAGPTGSGKTTFANAVLHALYELSPTDRIISMEDTPELQVSHPNQLQMVATGKNTLQNLIKTAMRQSPDRIIIGEVRDGVALDLLKSWNTGHPGGVTTLHANSCLDSLMRLEMLIAERTESPMQRLIAQSVGLIFYIQRVAITGPTLTEIAEVVRFDRNNEEYEVRYLKENQAMRSFEARNQSACVA